MVTQKRLGVYWGETGLSLVETKKDQPGISFFVSFKSESFDSKENLDDLQILENLQQAIRNQGVEVLNLCVALPSKDILIRSFVIPWMKTNEIHAAVSFEARKYIPFSIEETAYTYYPTTNTKDGTRQIEIIFVAIHKNVLAKYTNVFVQAGLNVVYSEPAAMSLLRTLVLKKLINHDQNTAIFTSLGNSGEFIIASRGHVRFVRDFKVNVDLKGAASLESDNGLRTRIYNEIRISFEFFSRQFTDTDIAKLIIVSSDKDQSFWSGLSEDISAPVEVIDSANVFAGPNIPNVDGAKAFGAALYGEAPSIIDFNLFEGASTSVSLKKEDLAKKSRQFILPVIMLILGVWLVLAALFFSNSVLSDLRNQVSLVSSNIEGSVSIPLETISGDISSEKKKLAVLKTLPIENRITPIIIRMIKRMPAKMTLNKFSLSVNDVSVEQASSKGTVSTSSNTDAAKYEAIKSKFSLNIEGDLSAADTNTAYKAVNKFVNTLRRDDLFASKFKQILLPILKVQEDPDSKAKKTAFTISCEGL